MSKYKVGYKAIVEIDKVFEQDGEKLYRAKGMKSLVFDGKGLDKLEPIDKYKIINLNAGRLAGQNEAWELARKIVLQPINGGYKRSEFEEIFGCGYISDIFEKYTYQEAAAKFEAWEKAKENKRFDESCDTCKFESTEPWFNPCSDCRHCYLSRYEPKAGEE